MAELGFVTHHAPTSANPHLPPGEIAALRATMRPEIASQELDALFVSLEGMSIFPLSSLLVDGEPVPDDVPIDTIGVTIDSAAGEGGIEHDGTAAIIYGMRNPRIGQGGFDGGEVVILDWDIRSLALGAAGAWLARQRSLSPLDPARASRGWSRRHLDREAGDGPQAAGARRRAACGPGGQDGVELSGARMAAPWRSNSHVAAKAG